MTGQDTPQAKLVPALTTKFFNVSTHNFFEKTSKKKKSIFIIEFSGKKAIGKGDSKISFHMGSIRDIKIFW